MFYNIKSVIKNTENFGTRAGNGMLPMSSGMLPMSSGMLPMSSGMLPMSSGMLSLRQPK